MGRRTVRSLVEAKEGGGAPTARSSLPLHHPSDGPPPHSLREQGGDGMLTIRRLPAYPVPPTQGLLSPFKINSVPSHHGRDPCQTPAHPVGGEGVGSSAPMSAGCGRAMKPGGWIPRGSLRRSMDGLRLLAARLLCGPPTKVMSAARRRQQCLRRDPVRSELRATTRRARGKRPRGARRPFPTVASRADQKGGQTGLVETVPNLHRARPGRPAPSPPFRPCGREALQPVRNKGSRP